MDFLVRIDNGNGNYTNQFDYNPSILVFINRVSIKLRLYCKAHNIFVYDLPYHAMNLNINTIEKPMAEELKFLFAQTSWASKRQIEDIEYSIILNKSTLTSDILLASKLIS